MIENDNPYCRICGEGCGHEVPFCADWRKHGGVTVLGPPSPEPFWKSLWGHIKRALRLRR